VRSPAGPKKRTTREAHDPGSARPGKRTTQEAQDPKTQDPTNAGHKRRWAQTAQDTRAEK